MPTPRQGENQKDFVSRCIPLVMDEGTANDNKQAAAICHSMWRDRNKSLLDKIVDAIKQVIPQDEDTSGLMLWKEADGRYHWVARYSNNFRDEDNPPEIISEKSHRRFVELVDKGEIEPPELWLWHTKDWKWGQADWVAYDDSGFALAGGTVDEGKEHLAKAIADLSADAVRVSHGMPKTSIKRDEDDDTVIVEHITREISPLPAWAAANQLTGFIMSKEVDMAIPEEKLEQLQEEWGLSDDILGTLQAANAADAEEGKEAGIEQKDKEDTPEETPPEPAEPEPEAEKPLTREELGEVVTAIGQSLTTVSQQIEALAGEVKELKQTKAAEDEETLTDLFKRAANHEQARQDGRESLAKKGPTETEPEEAQSLVMTGNPLVDNVVTDIMTGDWMDSLPGAPKTGQEV